MPELVIKQRRRNLGGFEVGRVLPSARRRMVGAFIFFGHMGPVEFQPGINIHWELSAGVRAGLPVEYPERAIYVAAGGVEVEGQSFEQGEMLVFAPRAKADWRAGRMKLPDFDSEEFIPLPPDPTPPANPMS